MPILALHIIQIHPSFSLPTFLLGTWVFVRFFYSYSKCILSHGRFLTVGFEFNSSSKTISGVPEYAGTFQITITASTPAVNVVQNHVMKIMDPLAFSSKLTLNSNPSSIGQIPSDFSGLSMLLDSSMLPDLNGSILSFWPDLSGNDRSLDRVRGNPEVRSGSTGNGLKVVGFDGLSQMYSSYDWGGFLNDYTILSVVRHTGGMNESVISSVGSNWVFGLGDGKSGYWQLGETKLQGPTADQSWHLMTGRLSQDGNAMIRRDRYVLSAGVAVMDANAKPKFLSIGGSQANDLYSKSEVAEVLLYNRSLTDNEILKLERYLHNKWLGGSLDHFPLLVRLSSTSHPEFDFQSFASPLDGGDLRFYDESNKELPFEIDEWNSSGESLVWVRPENFVVGSPLYAYWGNDNNTSMPVHDIWTDYQGVWHLADNTDSSSLGNDTATVGVTALGSGGLIGHGLSLCPQVIFGTGYKGYQRRAQDS